MRYQLLASHSLEYFNPLFPGRQRRAKEFPFLGPADETAELRRSNAELEHTGSSLKAASATPTTAPCPTDHHRHVHDEVPYALSRDHRRYRSGTHRPGGAVDGGHGNNTQGLTRPPTGLAFFARRIPLPRRRPKRPCDHASSRARLSRRRRSALRRAPGPRGALLRARRATPPKLRRDRTRCRPSRWRPPLGRLHLREAESRL